MERPEEKHWKHWREALPKVLELLMAWGMGWDLGSWLTETRELWTWCYDPISKQANSFTKRVWCGWCDGQPVRKDSAAQVGPFRASSDVPSSRSATCYGVKVFHSKTSPDHNTSPDHGRRDDFPRTGGEARNYHSRSTITVVFQLERTPLQSLDP
jgi:hypothetical protein